ncbi:MAG: hypothetical protein AAFZ63_27395 [Bacteroidota bacterium]
MSGYEVFHSQLRDAVAKYPSLKIIRGHGPAFLKGTFDVVDDTGKQWDSFEIEIKPTANFPKAFPLLFEVGDKIPKIADWHIYEDKRNCCITLPILENIFCKGGITIAQFIHHHVRPHLFNQAHRRAFGFYANGEYDHGVLGKWQYYMALFGTASTTTIIDYLKRCIGLKKCLNKKSKCFCGSDRRMRKCHYEVYAMLKAVDKSILSFELVELRQSLQLS